jgi:hypothetical protein
MSDLDGPPLPQEYITPERLNEIIPGYALFKPVGAEDSESQRGTILRIGHRDLQTVGDWLSYTGWDMPEDEKDENQKKCEEICKRKVVALYPLTLTDRVIMTGHGINLEDYDNPPIDENEEEADESEKGSGS